MLTKQLKALIDTSLAAGRKMEDVREILKKQGFLESAINELFSEYREGSKGSYQETAPSQTQAPAPSQMPPTTIASPVQAPPQAASAPISDDPFHQFDDSTPVVNPNPVQTPPPVSPATPSQEPVSSAPISDDPFHQFDDSTPAVSLDSPDHPNSFSDSSPPVGMSSASIPTPSAQTPPPDQMPPAPLATPPTPSMPVSTPPTLNPAPPENTAPSRRSSLFNSKKEDRSINVGLGGVPELKNAAINAYQEEKSKSIIPLIIVIFLILAVMGGFAYWYLYLRDGGIANQEVQINVSEESDTKYPIQEPIDPSVGDPFTGSQFDNNR